jgi:undecaprenyl phosphate N,N'-diacetylbacillosamine 1-phosphate transferase
VNTPIEDPQLRWRAYPGKPLFDRLAAGGACLALTPLAAAMLFASWAAGRPSPLELQERIGRDRRTFGALRFSGSAAQPRGRFGQALQGSGLGQLPQLVNVLRGEMSLVGPEPLTPGELSQWQAAALDWRFAARPGVTGLAQLLRVRGARNRQRLDRLYLRHQSLALDLQLLALSAAAQAVGTQRLRRWLRRLSRW